MDQVGSLTRVVLRVLEIAVLGCIGASLFVAPHGLLGQTDNSQQLQWLAAAAVCALPLIWYGQVSEAVGRFRIICSRRWFYYVYGAFVVLWTTLLLLKQAWLGYHTWDMGFFAQPLASLAQGGRFFSTIKGVHPFSDHFCPAVLLLTPLFALWPSVIWLVLAKLAAYISCPLILLRMGEKVLGRDSRLAFVAPYLFMVHSYLQRTVLFEFQPSSLALPFVLLAFSFAFERRTAAMICCLVSLIAFKEHLPLVWLCVGVYLCVSQHRFRLSSALVVLGILIGLGVQLIVIPYFNNWLPAPHAQRFGPLHYLPDKAELIALTLASVGFLPMLSPRALLTVLPSLGLSLVCNEPSMLSFEYHYQDIPLTVAFVGVIIGLEEYQANGGWIIGLPRMVKEALLAVAIGGSVFLNSEPSLALVHWPSKEIHTLRREAMDYRTRVSKHRTTWVTQRLLPLYIDLPYVKSFDVYQWEYAIKHGQHTIIMTDSAETSSLSPPELYQSIRDELDRATAKGMYFRSTRYKHLLVYRSRW